VDGESFAESLRGHRQRMRLTQEQLAQRAGLGVRTLRDLEAGRVRRPQRESVRLLAEALGLSGEQRRRFASVVPALALDPPAEPRRAAPVPAQLPADVADFTGREAAGCELTAALTGGGAAVAVSAVAGRAGVGKTALAVHVAHQVRSAFPDGQLYVDLRGAQAQALDWSAVLASFLQALGVEPGAVPADARERAGLFRSQVADRRVLVLLDNAASEAQVRPLLPAGPGCAVLVTSRRRLAGLEGARRLDLDVLDEREALILLGRVAGAGRVEGDPAAMSAIVGYCGRLPLAVRIAGAKLAARRDWSVGELAHRLADERRRLDELRAGDLEVRASAALSYRTLPADARRAFRLLGLLDAPDLAGWVAAALLDADLDRAQELVDELVDAQLLDAAGRDGTGTARYRFHDLLRVYARDRAAEDEDDAEAALHRALSGWLSLTEAAERRLPDTSNSVPARAARPWSAPPGLAERLVDDPLAWFEAEERALVHAVEHACSADLVPLAWELAARLIGWFTVRSHWEPWRHTHELALEACRRTGDRSGQATMLLGLGRSACISEPGVAQQEQALALFRETGDEVGEARANVELAMEYNVMVRYEDALAAADRALAISRRRGLREIETDAVMGRWRALLDLGRLDEAAAANRELLDLLAGRGARRTEAQALCQLARARRAAGDLEPAARLLDESLRITRELGDQYGEAYVLVEYAQVQAERGRVEDAEQALTASLDLSGRVPVPTEAPAALALGRLRLGQGRGAEAAEWFARAERLWDASGNAARAAEARAARSGAAQGPLQADRA